MKTAEQIIFKASSNITNAINACCMNNNLTHAQESNNIKKVFRWYPARGSPPIRAFNIGSLKKDHKGIRIGKPLSPTEWTTGLEKRNFPFADSSFLKTIFFLHMYSE